jgi:hypothetical protein
MWFFIGFAWAGVVHLDTMDTVDDSFGEPADQHGWTAVRGAVDPWRGRDGGVGPVTDDMRDDAPTFGAPVDSFENFLVTGTELWDNVAIEATVSNNDNDGLGLVIRYAGPGSYYACYMTNDRFASCETGGERVAGQLGEFSNPDVAPHVALLRVDADKPCIGLGLTGPYVLDSADWSFTKGDDYRMRLSAIDGDISCQVDTDRDGAFDSDEDLLLSFHDEEPLPAGQAGMLSWDNGWGEDENPGAMALVFDDVETEVWGLDSDNDGVVDEDELAFGTDPYNEDSDGDGILDAEELLGGDADNDGIIDALDNHDDTTEAPSKSGASPYLPPVGEAEVLGYGSDFFTVRYAVEEQVEHLSVVRWDLIVAGGEPIGAHAVTPNALDGHAMFLSSDVPNEVNRHSTDVALQLRVSNVEESWTVTMPVEIPNRAPVHGGFRQGSIEGAVGESLACHYGGNKHSDPDGDVVHEVYRWFNGFLYRPEYTESVLPAGVTEYGERWRCETWLEDELGLGAFGVTMELTVRVRVDPMVATGAEHSCFLAEDGEVQCWGGNDLGQSDPTPGVYTHIDADGDTSCGVSVDGTIECWGEFAGTLEARPRRYFVEVAVDSPYVFGLHDNDGFQNTTTGGHLNGIGSRRGFVAIAAGGAQRCGLRDDGSISCTDESPPSLGRSGRYEQVDVGTHDTCAVLSNGRVACWGATRVIGRDVPEPPRVGGWEQVSVGAGHACAVDTRGRVKCWGDISRPPVIRMSHLSAGDDHHCGVALNDDVVCWGADESGQATP